MRLGQPLRVMALPQFRRPSYCLVALLIVTGWCRAAEVQSAAGDSDFLAVKDPASQDPGSQDHVARRNHPKAPPRPTRDEDIPLNSRLFDLHLGQGIWSVIVEDDTPDSKVRDLIRHVCEKGGESDPTNHSVISARVLAAKHGYQRTNNWFEHTGASNVFDEYLASLAMSAADRPVNVLEVGSFEGGSALWIAEHLLLHPDSMLICIDLWTGGADLELRTDIDGAGSEDRFRSNMAKAPNNERVTAIKGDSMLSLSGLIGAGGTSTFDAIYIDGSHTMQHVLADALLSFRLLKVGGFLIFDDMKNFPGVGRAATAVIEALEEENCVEILHNENQMVARKTAEDRWITPASVVTMGKREDSPLLSTFAVQPTMAYTAYK